MKKINQDAFDESVKASEDMHLLVFSAGWCQPCRMMNPILKEAEAQHPSITFVKIDIDDEPDLADDFDITSIPTYILYQNGNNLSTKVGMVSKKDLNEWLEDNE